MKSGKTFFSLPVACAIWLAVRLLYNGLRQLVPDEAYYWVWSRHLAGGYLDHPFMVAWLIRAGAALFGDNEFAVRCGAAVMTLGTILIVMGLIHCLCTDSRAMRIGGWILLLSPLTAVLGTIITPDTPACFFSAAALASAIAALRRRAWWLVFGPCMGLAMDSKYTAVLVGSGVALAIFSTPQGRRELRSPFVWLSLLLALAVFSPVVLWNYQHDWASFRFQWHHGAGGEPSSPLMNLSIYIAGQAAMYTPVLFILGLAALIWRWRHWRELATQDRMVLLAATLPLVFFGIFSLRHKPEANWPIFAYLPLTVILVQWLACGWQSGRMKWLGIGMIVAGAALIVSHVPEVLLLVPRSYVANIPNPWEQMFGWRDFGRALDERSGGAAVYCTSYENAAEASFYIHGRPDVWTIDTDRPTAFDYFAGRPDPASLEKLVCVTRANAKPEIPDALRSFTHITVESWNALALRRVVRRRDFIVAGRD